jgi:hypothetical protein
MSSLLFKAVGWECMGVASDGSGNARGGKDGRKKRSLPAGRLLENKVEG